MQTLNRLRVCANDVNQAFVDLHLEGFTAGFIDVWRLHNGESAAFGWKRNWAAHFSAGPNRGVHDLARALVDHAVIIGLKADADSQAFVFLGFCHFDLSSLITSQDWSFSELIINVIIFLL